MREFLESEVIWAVLYVGLLIKVMRKRVFIVNTSACGECQQVGVGKRVTIAWRGIHAMILKNTKKKNTKTKEFAERIDHESFRVI